MNPLARPLLPLMLALTVSGTAQAESRMVTGSGGSASASIDFRIVVPPIIRLLANSHPNRVSLAGTEAVQQLEVLTTMRQGFCASLRLNMSGVRDWDVRSVGGAAQVLRTADGYRVCALRNGRHQVALLHRFEFESTAATGELPWPVQTDLSAL